MRKPGRLLAAVAAVALALGSTVLAPLPARANAESFLMSSQSYGANATVMIDVGALTRDCDWIYTTSAIYVVPAGSVEFGGALSDVSGSPNTITSGLMGSGIIGETIGFTAPAGKLGPGTYDVIEDTCQDGIFNGSDSILRNAFTVTIPSGVPPLPDPAILAMKSGAEDMAEHWAGAAKSWAALAAAITAYTLISDAMDPVGFYLTYVCMALPGSGDPNIPITPWCPTVGIDQVIKLKLAVGKTMVDKAAHYRGIADDPPDPNFIGPAIAEPLERYERALSTPLERAMLDHFALVEQDKVLAGAYLAAMEKYQGAQLADEPAAALMHARAMQDLAMNLRDLQTRQNTTLQSFRSSYGNALDARRSELAATKERIETEGFNAEEIRSMRNLGLDDAAIESLADGFIEAVDVDGEHDSMQALLSDLIDHNNEMGAAWVQVHNELIPVVQHLAQAVAADEDAVAYPTAQAGGAYSLNENGTVVLRGSCTGCTTYEWDLDGDGDFDDATTAQVTQGFRGGNHLVGLRVTNADGLQAVDYALVSSTHRNRAPVHGSVTPTANRSIDLQAGDSQEFSLTATDQDNDAITTQWTVDGADVATGTTFTIEAAQGAPRVVRAVTTDPSGAFAASQWLVYFKEADADGDGWHANVDCDDDNAAVNPGATEIPGNGIDDDCNPETLDTGTPTASFTWEPEPVIVGETVTFTDTSTDPDGPIASRVWDVDADGTADATTPEVTHTFETVGTYDVTLTVVDSDGNEDTSMLSVVVTDRPVASFTWAPPAPEYGSDVTFTSTSMDSDGIASHEWDLDHDGVTFNPTSTDASPTATLAGPVTVALRVTDVHGAVSEVVTNEVAVSGPPAAAFNPRPSNGGTNMALAPHGATVHSYSSQTAPSYPAAELLDVDYPSNPTGWRTAAGYPTGWVNLDLGGPYQFDRVGIRPASSTSVRPQDVRVSVATDGTAPADYRMVLESSLANSSGMQVLELARPTEARWLRYEVLTNRGGSYAETMDLEAWTGQVGDAVVTFSDLSTDPDGTADIVGWQWGFGDGATSNEQHPTHTYAEPGHYTVTLTVTDATGATSTTSLQQVVMAPTIVPDFSIPANPREGSNTTFANTTIVPAHTGVLHREWAYGDGGSAVNVANGARTYTDNGTYEVTLKLTDSYGFVTSTTKSVEVANQPPTVTMPTTMTSWISDATPFSGLSVTDPGSADQASLVCVLDYGDGSDPVEIAPCVSTTVRLPHTYAAVGTYTASLKVTDKDGGETTRTSQVTVNKRASHVSGHIIPGTARDGFVDVRAMVWDTVAWRTWPGIPVTFSIDGGTPVTVSTDADGVATARLPFSGPTGVLATSVAEGPALLASADSDDISTVQLPPADVMFIVDESGSMGSYQANMRANIVSMSEQLTAANLDFQIGVAGLPTSAHDLYVKVPPTSNLDAVVDAANRLNTSNGGELGIDGIVMASQDSMGWRPAVGKCLVLIGDEPAQRRFGTTDAMAAQALVDGGVTLYSIVTTTDARTVPYQELATGSGGAFFSIAEFRDDPAPVLQALLEGCAEAVSERPDLNVTIDDGDTEVFPGRISTYTVTVANTGPVAATGVDLDVTLPAGVVFRSAADDGAFAAGIVSWPAFTLGAESVVTRMFTVEVTGEPGGAVAVRADVADDGASGADLTPGNNTATDTNTIVTAPPTPTVTTTSTVTATATTTATATATSTSTVTATATATATATNTATVTPTATQTRTVVPTVTATSTPTVTQTATVDVTGTATSTLPPLPGPTVTATVIESGGNDLYDTPGLHESDGRKWLTVCEPYSITVRCWTYIWGTQINHSGGEYWKVNTWIFNNLTYLASPREIWDGNPLAHDGTWVDGEDRRWRTECETAATGRNGCRSYVTIRIPVEENGQFKMAYKEVFNNMVRFS